MTSGTPGGPLLPPDPADQASSHGLGARAWIGVIAILVGIAGVIVANVTKLTVSKALFGGVYIRDEYRIALLYAGVALAVLGILLTLVAANRSSDPGVLSALYVPTILLLVCVFALGATVVAAYEEPNAQNASNSNDHSSAVNVDTTSATSPSYQAPPADTATSSSAATGCDCSVADLPHRCDPNISTTSGLTCSFAQNTFYEYYKASGGDPNQPATIQTWSPHDGRYYTQTCSSGDGVVDCSTASRADVRFNQSAISAYTQDQASSYSSHAQLGPNG